MMSVMSSGNDGGVVPPPEWVSSAVGEEKSAASTIEYDFAGGFGFGPVTSNDEAARVRGFGSDETRISGNVSDSRVFKLESEENRTSSSCSEGGGNQRSPSACRLHGTSEKSSSRSGKLERKTNMNVAEDHDSIVSALDQFAAKGTDEAVGYGFKIGDMVWGKVKSHPWWPGQIYNETLASASVRRGKHEGHVLVAFFGDSSYGWFDPEELIPFEENFAEKSRQTTLRSFLNAVEEAADELARRSSLGLTCRCRNEFNFSPSSVDGYFVVDVGDSEAGVYSLGQISEAHDSFQPKDMVSFLHEVALKPMSGECSSVEFIKQRAAALAIRKGFFEDFDETYAQAFGTRPLRPSRPSAPVAVDPLKAPLSGRLVIAEALGNRKISPKPAKTKGQLEKDKYSFTRREDSVQIKSKKASSAQVGHSPRPLSVNGQLSGIRNHVYRGTESSLDHDQDQLICQNAPSEFRPSESSRKLVEGGIKKVKFLKKRPAGESTADNALHVKKKKRKVINAETGAERRQFPLAVSDSIVATKNVSRMPLHVDSSGLEDKKIDASVGFSTSQSQQADDFAKIELQMLVSDLRALALDPFHGEQKSCPAVIKQVFLKFRSLVYQKSLVLVPPVESQASEGNPIRLPASSEKTYDKKKKPPFRPDDPTRGGKKPDLPETVQKKKLDTLEGVKRKKVDDYIDSKKKKIDISKSLTVEKRILQRSAEYQLGNAKDSAVRAVPPTTLLKSVKQRQESSKKAGQMTRSATPTMLVMKFPAGAALPSIPQLKAKFARFGPLDQSATRVFWKTYTCRLVYQHKIDAQAALKFVDGGSNLFGNTNVRCYLRETEAEAVDSEPVQPQKEDTLSQARDSEVEANTAAKAASQQLQHLQSLKSCLKKPYADEGGMGGGRGGRVKFVLRGEESSSKGDEFPLDGNKKSKVASFSHGASSVHSSLNSSSKNLPKFNLQSSNTFVPSLSLEQTSWGAKDISEEMVNLLMRCNDVVNNLSAALGCMPYYPL